MEISQNFVAFSEYLNFNLEHLRIVTLFSIFEDLTKSHNISWEKEPSSMFGFCNENFNVIFFKRYKIDFTYAMLIISHCEFLEYWNTQKSVWRIWQHFSFLLDERIQKMWKKLNSHSGFLRADWGRAKMCCQMGWIGCAIFAGSSKSHRENSISFIILEFPHQVDMKNVVKSSKHCFGYFNTLETHILTRL